MELAPRTKPRQRPASAAPVMRSVQQQAAAAAAGAAAAEIERPAWKRYGGDSRPATASSLRQQRLLSARGRRRPASARPASARVDCGQSAARGQTVAALEKEIAALQRVLELERARAPLAGEAAPDPERLAVFSKVFDHLIKRSTTLKPLLSRIKESFDSASQSLHRQHTDGLRQLEARQSQQEAVALAQQQPQQLLVQWSDNPMDARYEPQLEAMGAQLRAARQRLGATEEKAAARRARLAGRRAELERLRAENHEMADSVTALQKGSNRLHGSLKQINLRRVSQDEDHTSGYWLRQQKLKQQLTNKVRCPPFLPQPSDPGLRVS